MSKYRYGRLPRSFSPAVPHFSAIKMMRDIVRPTLPAECHNAAALPADLGFMCNARLGCCTVSGLGHAEQLWTLDAQGLMVTVPDACVELAYHEACGYEPGHPDTDEGGNEQDVLTWATNTGFPQADGNRQKLLGFVEVDPRNPRDICETILECGVAYIGFSVPELLPEDPAGALWSGAANLGPIEGGHCVILTGFTNPADPTFDVDSWGMPFLADWSFVQKYVDEIYGLFSAQWIKASGRTPWGIDLATLEAQMEAIPYPVLRIKVGENDE